MFDVFKARKGLEVALVQVVGGLEKLLLLEQGCYFSIGISGEKLRQNISRPLIAWIHVDRLPDQRNAFSICGLGIGKFRTLGGEGIGERASGDTVFSNFESLLGVLN